MRKELILRRLIRVFFADYLSLVEPDVLGGKRCRSLRFPRKPLDGTGVVAEAVSAKGEKVTVLVRIEPEVLPDGELSARIRQSLRHLRVLYGEVGTALISTEGLRLSVAMTVDRRPAGQSELPLAGLSGRGSVGGC